MIMKERLLAITLVSAALSGCTASPHPGGLHYPPGFPLITPAPELPPLDIAALELQGRREGIQDHLQQVNLEQLQLYVELVRSRPAGASDPDPDTRTLVARNDTGTIYTSVLSFSGLPNDPSSELTGITVYIKGPIPTEQRTVTDGVPLECVDPAFEYAVDGLVDRGDGYGAILPAATPLLSDEYGSHAAEAAKVEVLDRSGWQMQADYANAITTTLYPDE
ncbi:MAG: hypothetical protein JWN38_58 [Candidatus Saccharibacteria bacterium]|nr:hypothetical protein [Candidatus Saccharibacteria bacterium]